MKSSTNVKAIDVVRQMVADGQVSQEVAEKYFPELKESEGEEIRKEIVKFIVTTPKERNNHKKWLAWLEKQSEQGNNEDEAILHRFSFYSYKDEPNILYLAGLYVNDEYRNKGIGTKILKIADEVAVSMKCSSILLKTEIGSNAERLYKNNGYSVFKREENQVWLEKQGEQKPLSKEDRKIIIELIGIFESAVDGGNVTFPYRLVKDYIRVLKSLKG